MTSCTSPSARRCTSSLMRRSSGPMPSMGLSAPPSTWYSPRYSRVRSIAATSFGSSTTQIAARLRRASRQMPQRSWSATLPQREQKRTFSRTSSSTSPSRAHVEAAGLHDVERDALRRLRPDAGQAAELVDQLLDDAFVHGQCSFIIGHLARDDDGLLEEARAEDLAHDGLAVALVLVRPHGRRRGGRDRRHGGLDGRGLRLGLRLRGRQLPQPAGGSGSDTTGGAATGGAAARSAAGVGAVTLGSDGATTGAAARTAPRSAGSGGGGTSSGSSGGVSETDGGDRDGGRVGAGSAGAASAGARRRPRRGPRRRRPWQELHADAEHLEDRRAQHLAHARRPSARAA